LPTEDLDLISLTKVTDTNTGHSKIYITKRNKKISVYKIFDPIFHFLRKAFFCRPEFAII